MGPGIIVYIIGCGMVIGSAWQLPWKQYALLWAGILLMVIARF